MLDSELLRRFYVTAQSKNLTHAAKKLNMVQSAISNSIAALEAQLKTQLFSRTRAGLVVNAKGLELCDYVQELMDRTAQFEKKFHENEEKMQGDLRVTTFPYIGAELLIPALQGFLNLYPKINFKINLDPDNIIPMDADIAIGSFIDSYPDLVHEELFSSHTHLFASQRYIENFGEPKSPKELNNHRIVSYKDPNYRSPYRSSSLAFEIREDKKTIQKPYIQVDSLHGIIRAALEGYGICELVAYPNILKLPLKVILPEHKGELKTLYYIYNRNRSKSEKIKKFYEYLKETLQVNQV